MPEGGGGVIEPLGRYHLCDSLLKEANKNLRFFNAKK